MQKRLKMIRKHFGMTQAEFAQKLGIGQSTLAMMEVSKRDISDRHIKSVCAICNVNEEWLRTGSGEMFIETKDDFISSLISRFDLDNVDVEILSMYFEMPSEYRKRFRNYLKAVVDSGYQDYKKDNPDTVTTSLIDPDIEEEIECYRRELEIEKRAAEKSSALPGAKEA